MAAPEILNTRKVATLRRVGQKSARALAQSGALPRLQAGGRGRLRRTDIHAWIEAQTGGRATASDGERPQ